MVEHLIALSDNERIIPVEHATIGGMAAWESGGASESQRGDATIIAGPNGEKKRPIAVRAHFVPNDKHALIPISVGDLVIQSTYYEGDFTMWVGKVADFVKVAAKGGEKAFARLVAKHRFESNRWDLDPPPQYEAALRAAAQEYQELNCRQPFYCQARR